MLAERTVSIATRYWASHLGCSPGDLFAQPLQIVTHAPALADYCGAFALFRDGAAIVSIPPERAETIRLALSALLPGCSPVTFASALSSFSIASIGPAYIGYTASVGRAEHPARALGPPDAPVLHALQQSCAATEWKHGGIVIEQPCSGVFAGRQLVAVAGYDVWGGTIAHISVVTHPDFRNRGFGRSAVSQLAERAIHSSLLPQYRTLESNLPSIRIAESLGFSRYAVSMAVRLNRAD